MTKIINIQKKQNIDSDRQSFQTHDPLRYAFTDVLIQSISLSPDTTEIPEHSFNSRHQKNHFGTQTDFGLGLLEVHFQVSTLRFFQIIAILVGNLKHVIIRIIQHKIAIKAHSLKDYSVCVNLGILPKIKWKFTLRSLLSILSSNLEILKIPSSHKLML